MDTGISNGVLQRKLRGAYGPTVQTVQQSRRNNPGSQVDPRLLWLGWLDRKTSSKVPVGTIFAGSISMALVL